MELAHSSNANETQSAGAGKRATGGAVIGAVSADDWRLVRGRDVAIVRLAGAAAGATAGAVSGGLQSTETSTLFRNFVHQCLPAKAYSATGWQ